MQSDHSDDHVGDRTRTPSARNSRQSVVMAPPADAEGHTTTAAQTHAIPPSASRARTAIETFSGLDVTDEMLDQAAELFSEHYGVWSEHAPHNKPGSRVRMSAARLRKQCLPAEVLGDCIYVRYLKNGELVGNAFACTWRDFSDSKVRWITQLVVQTSMRSQGIATKMLQVLCELDIEFYGIITSYPYACGAMSHAFEDTASRGLEKVRERAEDLIYQCGESLLKSSPIEYIRTAKLRRTINRGDPDDKTEDTVDTSFFVDHTEQKAILEIMEGSQTLAGKWYWGELLEGYEHFMLVVPELSHWRDTILRHTTWQVGHRLVDNA